MKRARRDRALGVGAFLVVYSVLQAVSSAGNGAGTTVGPTTRADVGTTAAAPTTTLPSVTEREKDDKDDDTTTTAETLDFSPTTPATTRHSHYAAAPTWRPKRDNCTPPAIEQFPQPLMGKYARRHGGLIIHVLVAVFTFMGLAIVCDDYFVSSLDRICEELKMSPDVAGATFMAAGSSAPELATVIIGVFFAKDDIGVSGVIGSAVFNIMFVISVCALCAGTVSHLNWWPLCRDSFFYAVSILVMLATIFDDVIKWPEAAFMMFMYVVYCVALHFNPVLERWAMSLNLPFKLPTREEQAALVTYKTIPSNKSQAAKDQEGSNYTEVEGGNVATTTNVGANHTQQGYMNNGYENAGYNADLNQTWDPNKMWGDNTQPAQPEAPVWDPASNWGTNPSAPSAQQGTNYGQWGKPPAEVTTPGTISTAPSQPAQAGQVGKEQQQLTIQAAAGGQNYYRPKEYNPDNIINPLDKPENASVFSLGLWYVVYPIHFACRLTMPDCRSEKYRNWYPFTFFVSMVWISFYSYFMVWMITIIGSTLGIPDTVMGLTFVAAGVSVPDALSSLAVIKEGYGDMAVSNAVGSNVFDILICLGLPWFIQTAIIKPGSHVNVISKGLIYSTLSLLSTVVFLVLATHLNGWKLDRKYGIILMVWYLLFITFASLYELNVFGKLNPPECTSNF